MALTFAVMKCFEKLESTIVCLSDLDLFQFTYKEKTSTEDTVATTIHFALTYLEHQGIYIRLCSVDFS